MARLDLTQTNEVKKLLKDKPPLPPTQEGLDVLQQIVDRAVRGSRDQYWCERLEAMLEATVPQMAASDGHFYASDDLDCRKARIGQDGKVFNDMGYNSDGVDRDGWDRRGNPPSDPDTGNAGQMPNGFSRAYDKDGYDHLGVTASGILRDGTRRRGRGPTPEEEAVPSLLNPTTAILGPDGKLYMKGTVFTEAEVAAAALLKVPVKRATRKVAVKAAVSPTGDVEFALV